MARRQAPKPGRAKAKNKSPVSDRTRKRLTGELKKARNRIKGLMDRMGASYEGPAIQDFYLDNVLNLISQGVHINTVYAMIRNTTAEKIRASNVRSPKDEPIVSELYGGAPVTQRQYSRLMASLSKANKNIDKARAKFDGFDDVLPAHLTPDDILRRVTSTKRLYEVLDVVDKAFTQKKLIPIAISDTGEAGTEAEVEFLQSFITNENKRRAEGAEQLKDILKSKGFFKTQQEFQVTPINTNEWDTMEKWRRRTDYFTDSADLDKANNWLTNYVNSLRNLVDTARISNAPVGTDFYENADYIFSVITHVDTPDKVRALTRFAPRISIEVNYITLDSELDAMMANLAMDWLDFELEYNT